ncbi:DUF6482 family protein [Sessilibacter sp. MAH2]
MRRFSIRDLATKSVDKIIVHSHGNFLYTIEVLVGEEFFSLSDNNGRTARFYNTESARQLFKQYQQNLDNAFLVQTATYGEMIGLEEVAVEPMQISLHWNKAHYDELQEW